MDKKAATEAIQFALETALSVKVANLLHETAINDLMGILSVPKAATCKCPECGAEATGDKCEACGASLGES